MKVDKTLPLNNHSEKRVGEPEEIYRTVEQKKLPYNKRVEFKEHIDNLKDEKVLVA
jgi:hypothetical protein